MIKKLNPRLEQMSEYPLTQVVHNILTKVRGTVDENEFEYCLQAQDQKQDEGICQKILLQMKPEIDVHNLLEKIGSYGGQSRDQNSQQK